MTTELTCSPAETKNGQCQPTAVYRPRIDITEKEGTVFLRVDLPGVDESDVDVTVEKNTLKIRGVRRAEEFEGYKLVHREHGSRVYERELRLSDELNRDGIEAIVTDGVLEVSIPRLENAGPQKIAIKHKAD